MLKLKQWFSQAQVLYSITEHTDHTALQLVTKWSYVNMNAVSTDWKKEEKLTLSVIVKEDQLCDKWQKTLMIVDVMKLLKKKHSQIFIKAIKMSKTSVLCFCTSRKSSSTVQSLMLCWENSYIFKEDYQQHDDRKKEWKWCCKDHDQWRCQWKKIKKNATVSVKVMIMTVMNKDTLKNLSTMKIINSLYWQKEQQDNCRL